MYGAIIQSVGMLVQTGLNVAATEISINEQWEKVNANLRGEEYYGTNWSIVLNGVGTGVSQLASIGGNAYQRYEQQQQQVAAQTRAILQHPVPNVQLQPVGPLSRAALSHPSPQVTEPPAAQLNLAPGPRITDQDLLDAYPSPAPAQPAPPVSVEPQISTPPVTTPVIPHYSEADDINLVSMRSHTETLDPWSSYEGGYSIDPNASSAVSLNYQSNE